jgi:hypothetical protein
VTSARRIDTRAGSSNGLWRPAAALAVLILAFAAPIIPSWGGTQQASRYTLTAAIWDQGTVVLNDYKHLLGSDHANRDGVIYSDKAPGQPYLVAPLYGVYRLAGGERPDLADQDPKIGLWWVTVWSASIPAAVLGILMYLWTREVERRSALIATLSVSFGTLLLVYSTLLFGHVLAATFAFGMFLIVRRTKTSWRSLAFAGLLGGLAVAVEFPVFLIVLVLTIAALVRHRWSGLAVAAGGLPVAVLIGLYNRTVTGSAFVTPIQWSGFVGPRESANEVVGLFVGPTLENLSQVLFSPRGLLLATPIVALGVAGIPLLYRKSRFDALVVSLAVASMLTVQVSWSSAFAGGAGPRYLVPALPFLAAPVALSWFRYRRTAIFLTGVSVLTMFAATLTSPQLASDFSGGLGFWLRLAFNGDFVSTVWTEIASASGWVIHGAIVLAALLVLGRADRSGRDSALLSTAA